MPQTIRTLLLSAMLATGGTVGVAAVALAQPAGSATGGASTGSSSSTGAPTTGGSAPRAAPGTSGTAITPGTQGEAGGAPAQPLPNGRNNTSGTSRLRSKTDSSTTVVPGRRS